MAPRPPPDGTVRTPQGDTVERSGGDPAMLATMHVLEQTEHNHEAAYILSRVSKRMGLNDGQRTRLVETTYGALRSLNRLDHAVEATTRRSVFDLAPWQRQHLRLAAYHGERGMRLDRLLPLSRHHVMGQGALQHADTLVQQTASDARAFRQKLRDGGFRALRFGHPDWFVALADLVLGEDDADALMEANNQDPPLVVRANTLKTDRDRLVEILKTQGFKAEASPWSPVGLLVTPKQGIFRSAAFMAGLFEVQDQGSQVISELVDAKPGHWILDACAGAGGKTLHLCAKLENRGRVVACDIHLRKLNDLKQRAGRAGAHNYDAFVMTPEGDVVGNAKELRKDEPTGKAKLPRTQYDRVLVDAPCSGTGTFRRTPDLRWRTMAEPALQAERQLSILRRAATRVAPGGRLVYATCSIDPVENEHVVEAFLKDTPGFATMPLGLAAPHLRLQDATTDKGWMRLWPHRHGTEGFFAAVLQRA